eukprot:37276-Pleurochrysis_carterae.AAC.2
MPALRCSEGSRNRRFQNRLDRRSTQSLMERTKKTGQGERERFVCMRVLVCVHVRAWPRACVRVYQREEREEEEAEGGNRSSEEGSGRPARGTSSGVRGCAPSLVRGWL